MGGGAEDVRTRNHGPRQDRTEERAHTNRTENKGRGMVERAFEGDGIKEKQNFKVNYEDQAMCFARISFAR